MIRARFTVWCLLVAGVVALLLPTVAPAPAGSGLERLLVEETVAKLTLTQLDDYRTVRLGDVERPGCCRGSSD